MKALPALLTLLFATSCIAATYDESTAEFEETGTIQSELAKKDKEGKNKKKKLKNQCIDVLCPVIGCTKQCTCGKNGPIYNCGCLNSGNGTDGEICDGLGGEVLTKEP